MNHTKRQQDDDATFPPCYHEIVQRKFLVLIGVVWCYLALFGPKKICSKATGSPAKKVASDVRGIGRVKNTQNPGVRAAGMAARPHTCRPCPSVKVKPERNVYSYFDRA